MTPGGARPGVHGTPGRSGCGKTILLRIIAESAIAAQWRVHIAERERPSRLGIELDEWANLAGGPRISTRTAKREPTRSRATRS